MKRRGSMLLVLAMCLTSVVRAQVTILDALRRATVFIRVQGDSGEVTGSGVIVTASGIVATAAHVMKASKSALIKLLSGDEYDVAGVKAT